MEEYTDIHHFNYWKFSKILTAKRGKGNPGTTKSRRYLDVLSAFDIEVTADKESQQAFMYIWQWKIEGFPPVVGRTWDEFLEFQQKLISRMRDTEAYMVVYVHNLSFEFQFLAGIYDFQPDEVFAMDRRKILKCDMQEHFEFRCSYIHSNMSLDAFTSKMGAEHVKLSGDDFDYSKTRYPWTKLSDQEMSYCLNDVLGLVEALRIEMDHDGDDLYTIPLTSTGYVRRDAKAAMRQVSNKFVKNQLPDWHTYELCREAFRGGNTHANRYYAGLILEDVHSVDISSSYPSVICNCKFPITKFSNIGTCSTARLQELVFTRGKAVLARVALYGVRLRDEFWGCPYLARSKCRMVKGATYDNGRILCADYLETTITDIDLRIILDEYAFDNLIAFDVSTARYGVLPRPLVECTIDYFEKKTELKNVEGSELLYMKSKSKLNSIYGMMATDPVKISIIFENGEFSFADSEPRELLQESNHKAFLTYAWGVWCTAWARYRLEEGIKAAGDGFVYCDTDSVKYVGDAEFSEINEEREAQSLESGAWAVDPNGEPHYMGVFESEGTFDRFATLGAKKYVLEENGKLQITIAGVDKKKGAAELEEAGGIEQFRPGFTFYKGGGTESVYNDNPPIKSITREGREIPITRNLMIKDSTYTLGITAEYAEVLRAASEITYREKWILDMV